MKQLFFTVLLFFSLVPLSAHSQLSPAFDQDESMNIGGDIFEDFNEDLEASQVMEDERFYRYSRFFGVNLAIGVTTFTGNRGLAYTDNHPSYGISLMYFMSFQTAWLIGFEYSQHTMIIDTYVNSYDNQILGAVETSMLRPFVGVRYYIDTSDLGTAITYSNPYFTGRLEYWYQTNRFPSNPNVSDQTGGGIGTGVGFGLEFPMELKESYFNVEFLYHVVNFFDQFSVDYRQITDPAHPFDERPSEYGYEDLTGDSITVMFSYNISW